MEAQRPPRPRWSHPRALRKPRRVLSKHSHVRTAPFPPDRSPTWRNQAVYIEVTDVPIGDELEVAYCSLAGGTQVVAQPQSASEIPGAVPTPTSLQYQYGAVTTNQTILAIPTEFDPDVSGAQPIVSQTSDQLFLQNNATGSFFCDNASNPCAVEIMDIPQNELQDVIQDGLPPATEYSAVGHTAIFPLTFNQGGNGCASSPLMQVDTSYSVEQFLPAAGAATCTGAGGVAVLPTELPSVDDPGCATGSGAHCPISDVINGTVPATFTDDPEDPATLAELKQAGGKFAYIPIAVSGTEIAFSGAAGVTVEGNSTIFPLQSYDLTPAQAAGIIAQLWSSPVAGLGTPNDDVSASCRARHSARKQCKPLRNSCWRKQRMGVRPTWRCLKRGQWWRKTSPSARTLMVLPTTLHRVLDRSLGVRRYITATRDMRF